MAPTAPGLGLGTEGYDGYQNDCKKSEAAHGMTP